MAPCYVSLSSWGIFKFPFYCLNYIFKIYVPKIFWNRVLKCDVIKKIKFLKLCEFVRIFWKNNTQEAYLPKTSIVMTRSSVVSGLGCNFSLVRLVFNRILGLLVMVSFNTRLKYFFIGKILYANRCKINLWFKEFVARLLDQYHSAREKKTKTASACFFLALFNTALKLAFKIATILALKS